MELLTHIAIGVAVAMVTVAVAMAENLCSVPSLQRKTVAFKPPQASTLSSLMLMEILSILINHQVRARLVIRTITQTKSEKL